MKIENPVLRLIMFKPFIYIGNLIIWSMVEILPLLPVFLAREILNIFTEGGELNNRFWWLVALTIGGYMVRIIFTYGGIVFGVIFAFNMHTLLRLNLLKNILKKPGGTPLPITTGEALNRFRDDVETVSEMVDWPIDVVAKMLCGIGAIVILLRVNSIMTLMVVIPLFIILTLLQPLRRKVGKYREASRDATGRVIGCMGEFFNVSQAIKIAAAEDYVLAHLQKLNHLRHKAILKETIALRVVEGILNNVVHIGTGGILLLSSYYISKGALTVGDLVLFIGYWLLVADFTENFGKLLSAFQQGRVSIKLLIELLGDTTSNSLTEKENIKLIGRLKEETACKGEVEALRIMEVRDLSYQYPDSGKAIENISFAIKKGSITVIAGEVACGKSTLAKVLTGLLPKDRGDVYWNHRLVEGDLGDFFVPPNCGYTGQTPNLFSDTVRNNILFADAMGNDENLTSAIRGAVLEDDLEGFPDGLDTLVGPKGMKLSGGQIQRVAIARMLATKSQLYVFDDISSGLDIKTEEILWSRLKEMKATCIVVSNRRTALEMADQIIYMKNGRIHEKGSLQELLISCGEIREIFSIHGEKS